MKYANLHLHSTYSDAGFTPLQLVLIGKSLGYYAMALTDHETDGGVPEFFDAAKSEGIRSIAGAEFYGDAFGAHFHIVGLDFDRDHPALRAFIKARCDEMGECTRRCFERGVALGHIKDATWDDVLALSPPGTWICIDQVIRALRQKGVLALAGGADELRKNCFKGEARAFFPKHPSAEEVIRVIRGAGGIAVLAHPYKQDQYVGKLVDLGLNGIEVSHPDLYENSARLASEAADAYHLYRSGGTDHTGALSCCGGNNAIPALQGITEEEYTILTERRLG
ncbi:MAG: PHP domain-containing protein [Clostridia bacterium]|nr:PHP domain-containing protein [Clostridia bacterium]